MVSKTLDWSGHGSKSKCKTDLPNEATNKDLVQMNQQLQRRLTRLTLAYQALERANLGMQEKCSVLEQQMEVLREHLRALKTDIRDRVEPIRLISRHLSDVARFFHNIDVSVPDSISESQDWPLLNFPDAPKRLFSALPEGLYSISEDRHNDHVEVP